MFKWALIYIFHKNFMPAMNTACNLKIKDTDRQSTEKKIIKT
jgi:hypothetical protein